MPSRRHDLKPYAGRGRDSGVSRYAIGADYIIVEFRSAQAYRYDYSVPGREAVETMKQLAESGHGLATYITQIVGSSYAERLW